MVTNDGSLGLAIEVDFHPLTLLLLVHYVIFMGVVRVSHPMNFDIIISHKKPQLLTVKEAEFKLTIEHEKEFPLFNLLCHLT